MRATTWVIFDEETGACLFYQARPQQDLTTASIIKEELVKTFRRYYPKATVKQFWDANLKLEVYEDIPA